MEFANYIKSELLILIPVLYLIGLAIKNTKEIPDKYIPALLGASGILLSTLYLVAFNGFHAAVVFDAITQGVLAAGGAVYTNELIKQTKRED